MNEREIFTAALAKENAAERATFLEDVCRDDGSLRQRIESLLAEHQQIGSFMDVRTGVEQTVEQSRSPLERTGTTIGPYKLLQQIGEGGMGVVYMARDQYERAVKWMEENQPEDEELRRLNAESKKLMQEEPGYKDKQESRTDSDP